MECTPNPPTSSPCLRRRLPRLFAIDVHSLWVNSKTLEIAGITAATEDPQPDFNYFYRDA